MFPYSSKVFLSLRQVIRVLLIRNYSYHLNCNYLLIFLNVAGGGIKKDSHIIHNIIEVIKNHLFIIILFQFRLS